MKSWRRRWNPARLVALALPIALVALTAACAGYDQFRSAHDEEELGHWDLAVMKYAKAVELNPSSAGYKAALERSKIKASEFHFEKGKMYRASGRPELAVVELEQTVLLDPTNDYANVELRKAREDMAKQEADRNADSHMEKIKKKTRGVRAVTPLLEPASDRPINLNFPQPKPIKQIYRALADAAGINIIFDPQLKDDNVSIVLTNIEFQKALETLIRQENHFYKIIDERTILIAADTPANRKTYEDLVIRTFFLSNGDVTEVANSLRALLQTTRISVNKAENSITLRDTADKVSVAERIVEQNDKQLSEVVIDVELLQINTDKADTLGLLLKPYSIGAQIPAPGGVTNLGGAASLAGGNFSWGQLKQININSFGFTLPTAQIDFIKNNGAAELLAKPQLRVSEGQKAQLLIGDKVPIPVTTFPVVGGTGANLTTNVTSFQYQDVGIKIEVEPRVHHNKEVTLKLQLEVSQITSYNAAGQPTIGTRTVAANIRLKDGETNFLAGLFRTDKTLHRDTIPWVGDIPLIGRLVSHTITSTMNTDVVLTLTPHIIRIPDVTEEDVTPVYVGTDANISYQGTPRVENPTGGTGPFEQQPQNPPRPGTQRQQPQTPPPPPINMAPSGGPSDIFKNPPNTSNPPTPQSVVPPQPRSSTSSSISEKSEAAPADGTDAAATTAAIAADAAAAVPTTPAVLIDFDPAYLSLANGQTQSILVRATASAGFPGANLIVHFDPKVVAALVARPILGSDGGTADATIDENGRVALAIPPIPDMSGTRVIAQITLRGVGLGRASLSFEPVQLDGVSTTLSQAVVDVR
ncbi:MAG TPA: secretin N-terminal domain-containing protein [Thermoanaerobaculia bacterium]|jgi:general secretion pathway protein D